MFVPPSVSYNLFLNVFLNSLLITTVIAIALHIFQAFALYSISKKRGYDKAWLSFIPIVNAYVLGGIYDNIKMHKRTQISNFSSAVNMANTSVKKSCYKIILLVFNVASFLLPIISFWLLYSLIFKVDASTLNGTGAIPFTLSVLFLVPILICSAVFNFIALYGIYSDYSPANSVILLILSILFPYITPILLFSIRSNQSVTLNNLNMQQQYAQQYEQQQTQYSSFNQTMPPNN